jgi:transcriptional regulator with XRE-family HTH domain
MLDYESWEHNPGYVRASENRRRGVASPEDTAAALARNLRRLRAERGLTLDELAKRAAISRSMLIQIEQRRVNPTLATLVRITQALDVGLAELVELGGQRRVRVIPREQVVELWASPGGSSGRLLVGSDQLDHIELWDWRLEPGDVHQAEAHLPGTVEIIHVLDGDLALEVGGESHAATAGESVIFSPDADHSYGNNGTRPLRVLMIVITPPAARTIAPGNDPRSGGAR